MEGIARDIFKDLTKVTFTVPTQTADAFNVQRLIVAVIDRFKRKVDFVDILVTLALNIDDIPFLKQLEKQGTDFIKIAFYVQFGKINIVVFFQNGSLLQTVGQFAKGPMLFIIGLFDHNATRPLLQKQIEIFTRQSKAKLER